MSSITFSQINNFLLAITNPVFKDLGWLAPSAYKIFDRSLLGELRSGTFEWHPTSPNSIIMDIQVGREGNAFEFIGVVIDTQTLDPTLRKHEIDTFWEEERAKHFLFTRETPSGCVTITHYSRLPRSEDLDFAPVILAACKNMKIIIHRKEDQAAGYRVSVQGLEVLERSDFATREGGFELSRSLSSLSLKSAPEGKHRIKHGIMHGMILA